MSGPVTDTDSAPLAVTDQPSAACVELSDSRDELVGRIRVRRALPRRGRRTIGAWCFADHMGPADVDERNGLSIGAHPHIGLQTVTWLLDGQVLHRDSLGSEQVITPGQLNLMTAGHGVSHSEEGTGHRGTVEGAQLWVAQPSGTRDSAPAFEHHGELPQVEYGNARRDGPRRRARRHAQSRPPRHPAGRRRPRPARRQRRPPAPARLGVRPHRPPWRRRSRRPGHRTGSARLPGRGTGRVDTGRC
jgi:hypothetical protein